MKHGLSQIQSETFFTLTSTKAVVARILALCSGLHCDAPMNDSYCLSCPWTPVRTKSSLINSNVCELEPAPQRKLKNATQSLGQATQDEIFMTIFLMDFVAKVARIVQGWIRLQLKVAERGWVHLHSHVIGRYCLHAQRSLGTCRHLALLTRCPIPPAAWNSVIKLNLLFDCISNTWPLKNWTIPGIKT